MTVAMLDSATPLAWLEVARTAIEQPFDPTELSPEQLRDVSRELGQLRAQVDARLLAVASQLDSTEAAKASGFTSTGALLAADFGGNRTAGDRLVRTAKNLVSAIQTQSALEAGQISLEQAEIVSRTMAGLPPGLDESTMDRVEIRLLSNARMLSVADLRKRVLRVADLYADKRTADQDEDEKLRLQEARAWANTEFWTGQPRDGLVTGGFKIPVAQADMLTHQIGALAAPRRQHLDTAQHSWADADEELTGAQRLGRAFCQWIEHVPTDGLPTTGGTPATLTVNLDYASLVDVRPHRPRWRRAPGSAVLRPDGSHATPGSCLGFSTVPHLSSTKAGPSVCSLRPSASPSPIATAVAPIPGAIDRPDGARRTISTIGGATRGPRRSPTARCCAPGTTIRSMPTTSRPDSAMVVSSSNSRESGPPTTDTGPRPERAHSIESASDRRTPDSR